MEAMEYCLYPPPPQDTSSANNRSIQHINQNLNNREIESSTENKLSLDLSDVVERILHSCEARQGLRNASSSVFEVGDVATAAASSRGLYGKSSAWNNGCHGGNLTMVELNHLSVLCTSTSIPLAARDGSTGISEQIHEGWGSVDIDTLTSLTGMLEEHVASAACVDLIGEARNILEEKKRGEGVFSSADQWLQMTTQGNSNGYHRVCVLRQGLEAASILLSIMTSPGVDRRVTSDDGIESCVSLMRHHLHRNVIPALSNTGHTAALSSSKNSSTIHDGEYDESMTPGKRKKLMRNKGSSKEGYQELIRWMKKVYKPIISSLGLLTLLIERVEILIQTIQVGDQLLLTLCPTALDSLTIEPAASAQGNFSSLTHVVQVACVGLISTIFRQYPRHREVILQDLFPLFRRLPTSKRSLRTFPVYVTGNYTQLSYLSSSSNHKTSAKETLLDASSDGGETQIQIQVMSSLILNLIQSCVTMPLGQESAKGSKKTSKTALPKLKSIGLEDSEKICNSFTALMIQRCSKKGEDGGASEFRPILSNLVQDLLHVHLVPEYPAAEMLLLSLCRKLSHDLLSNSSVGGKRNPSNNTAEATYLSTAMDILGTICSDIALKLAINRENPLEFPSQRQDIDTEVKPTREVNKCFCGRTSLVETFMLDCDRCHNWFHGSCVGIAKDNLPELWICDECTMQLLVIKQNNFLNARCGRKSKKDMVHSDVISEVDQTHIMWLLVLNFLTHRAKTSSSSNATISRQFYLAKWIRALEKERNVIASAHEKGLKASNGSTFDADLMCTHLLEAWHLMPDKPKASSKSDTDQTFLPAEETSNYQQQHLSNEGNSRLMLALYSTNSDLASSFPRLLGVLLSLMGDEDMVSLRKLAVRAISQIVEVDSSLMAQPSLRDAVAKRFQDEAISVREASVSLVGVYVLKEPKLANIFHNLLLARLCDNGISVRKRVVKIFREQMMSNPNYAGRASACTLMLQRSADPKEDDGVRDLIHETFRDLWFNSNSNNRSKVILRTPSAMREKSISSRKEGMLESNAAVVTPINIHDQTTIQPKIKTIVTVSSVTAKQLVEVVTASRSPEYLTILVKDLLFGLGEGDKASKAAERKRRQVVAQQHCASIVSALMEDLLTFEEQRCNQDTHGTAGSHLIALIATLGVFAEASPTLLLNNLDTLLPYLKADNNVSKEEEASIVFFICKILSRVVTCFTKEDIMRLGNGAVSDDLVKITYNFGSAAMSAAIESLAKLAAHEDASSDNPQKENLMKLAKTFYSYLFKMRNTTDDFSKVTVKVRNNVYRALSALGSICRFYDKAAGLDHNDMSNDLEFSMIENSALNWSNLPTASYAVIKEYLEKSDISTKCKALRAMAGIFTAYPRIMLAVEQNGLLRDIMSEEAHPQLQLEALVCWREILLSEEIRIESGEAKRQMESKEQITLSKKISGDQDGDASLIGACCTQHSSRLYEMTSNTNEQIRSNSLHLIEILLRQGLINPMETVPYLLALQGDVRHPAIRSHALRLLVREGEKRPDMLRQRVCAGIHRAFWFQRIVYSSNSEVTAFVDESGTECIFGQIFKDSVRSSRIQSKRILESLLSLFSGTGETFEEELTSELSPRNKKNKGKNKRSFLEQLPLLCFASEVIAHLPYNHLGDILFIVYHISGTISLEGNALIEVLADYLRMFGLASNDKNDMENIEEDVLEKSAHSENPKLSMEFCAENWNQFDVHKFAELCAKASSLVLLLRLKLFLCQAYNGITESRLREYLPTEKERVADRGIFKSNDSVQFRSNIDSCHTHGRSSLDLNILIFQYAEFRKLMRKNDEFSETVELAEEVQSDNSITCRSAGRKKRKRNLSESEPESDSYDDDEQF